MFSDQFIRYFWSMVNIGSTEECWDWKGYTSLGYGKVGLEGKDFRVHRVAYELTYGKISPSLYICHRCNNKACCNPSHLYEGTPKDNIHDEIIAETFHCVPHPCGSLNPRSKLTEEIVLSMREAYSKGGITMSQVADVFGVNKNNAPNIILRRTWKHI